MTYVPNKWLIYVLTPPKIQAKVHPTKITNYQHCQISWLQCPPKFEPKLVQQHHKLPTLPKFHKSPTFSRLHHDQKIQHFKNAPKPTLQYDQSYNAPNSNKITQQHNDNVSTTNFQFRISNSQISDCRFAKFQVSKFQSFNFQNFKRINLLNKFSRDKSPKKTSKKGQISMDKSSKDRSPWTLLQRTNLHEHIFIKGKSPEQIFKGQISMNKSSRTTPNPKFSLPRLKKFHFLNAQFLNPNL